MKALAFALACCLLMAAAGASAGLHHKKMSRRDRERAPRFLFTNTDGEHIDLGNITDLEYAVFSFEFTNVGKSPLLIRNAVGECGCTIPEVPKDPIPPGGKGAIKVTFNPTGKAGPFSKAIFIESNALSNDSTGYDKPYTVHIQGAVVPGLPPYHPQPKKE